MSIRSTLKGVFAATELMLGVVRIYGAIANSEPQGAQ